MAFPRIKPLLSADLTPHAWLSVLQGRHVKTGQLAAIKVMDVTEVRRV